MARSGILKLEPSELVLLGSERVIDNKRLIPNERGLCLLFSDNGTIFRPIPSVMELFSSSVPLDIDSSEMADSLEAFEQ